MAATSTAISTVVLHNRQLNPQLKVLESVRKRATDPSFEARLSVGHVPASRKPGAVQPVQRALFEIDRAAHFNLGHEHGGELESADFTFGVDVRNLDADVVAAVLERDDAGVIPHVTEPLPIGEAACFRPRDQSLRRAFNNAWAATSADDGTQFDLLVVFTPAARQAAGGPNGITSLIQLGVNEANLAYQNSGIIPRLRLVHTAEVSYVESGNIGTDLGRLQNPADGIMDEVHQLRDTYAADFVKIIVEAACGVAYLMGGNDPGFQVFAFSVTVGSVSVRTTLLPTSSGTTWEVTTRP